MKLDLYNQKNESVGSVEVSDNFFNVRWNPDLVRQAVTAQMANRREPLAHTKGRGEVSGGGKKPWKQKGTGRARHGSTRSPLWAHGGVSHGPKKERNFSKGINRKMNRLAIASIISKKIKDAEFKVIENFNAEEKVSKTKQMAVFLKQFLGVKAQAVLLIAQSANKSINTTTRNINKVNSMGAKSLNPYDLLKSKTILIEKDAVKEIENHYKL